jgi:hypothetical protein
VHSIKGIPFHSNGTVVSTPSHPLISSGKKGGELDAISSPYLTGVILLGENTGILISRGCVYPYTYCNFSAMFNHIIRYHSADRVIQELKYIQDHGQQMGVLFSAIPLLVYQGGITICAGSLQPVFTEGIITELTAVGGVLLVGLGITLLEIKQVKIMNMLPSLVVVVILAYVL